MLISIAHAQPFGGVSTGGGEFVIPWLGEAVWIGAALFALALMSPPLMRAVKLAVRRIRK